MSQMGEMSRFLMWEVPNYSKRFVPMPALLKLSACCDCGTWLIRRGWFTRGQFDAIGKFIREGWILYRHSNSYRGRPRCGPCQLKVDERNRQTRREAAE